MFRRMFSGGTCPPERKFAGKEAVKEFPPPETLFVPLSQHIGAPASPVVKAKEEVRKGQVLGEAGGYVSAPVHSPVSGTVKKIEKRTGSLGRRVDHVVIKNDFQETPEEGYGRKREWESLSSSEIKSSIQAAGLVGMGGAAFPTHVKLSPPEGKPIDTVILNGIECEPYLTCDYRLMLERSEEVLTGLKLFMRALGVSRGIFAVEANKRDAYQKLKRLSSADGANIELRLLPVRYPQGAEKQLIKAVLNREVPSGGLPMDVGVVVQNVGTAYAAYEACMFGKPLTERVVTVTGEGVENPGNYLCRVGTAVEELLDTCGIKESADKVIFGGPMTGLAQADMQVPVTKGSSGVVVLEGAEYYDSFPCIRCGACVRGCPMKLVPSQISIACEAEAVELFPKLNIQDCIECGVCTYVCPARRPIVHHIKLAKAYLAEQEKKGK